MSTAELDNIDSNGDNIGLSSNMNSLSVQDDINEKNSRKRKRREKRKSGITIGEPASKKAATSKVELVYNVDSFKFTVDNGTIVEYRETKKLHIIFPDKREAIIPVTEITNIQQNNLRVNINNDKDLEKRTFEGEKQANEWLALEVDTITHGRFGNLDCLKPKADSPLTNSIMDCYMQFLVERSKRDDALPKVVGIRSNFSTKLLESDYNYSLLEEFTKDVDIFDSSLGLVLVPIKKCNHWILASIHSESKRITCYDSSWKKNQESGKTNHEICRKLFIFLQDEFLHRVKMKFCTFDVDGWTFGDAIDIPVNENGYDSGVFTCMYAEFICRDRLPKFGQQHMAHFRQKIYEICTGEMLTD